MFMLSCFLKVQYENTNITLEILHWGRVSVPRVKLLRSPDQYPFIISQLEVFNVVCNVFSTTVGQVLPTYILWLTF